MPDNTLLNTGSGGDLIRDIAKGDAKTQVVTIDVGGSGPESLIGPTNGLPVRLDQTAGQNVVADVAPGNQATGQITASVNATTLVAARPTRKSVLIRNLDTAITVYIGPATVTAANGMPLKAGENVPVETQGLIQVIAASGTPTVAYYDVWY